MSPSYTVLSLKNDTLNYVFMNLLYCTWINSRNLTLSYLCWRNRGSIPTSFVCRYSSSLSYLQGKYTQPTSLYICRMYVSIKQDKISIYKLSRSSEGRWLTYTITQNICTHLKIKTFGKLRPLSGSVYLSIRTSLQITSAIVVNLGSDTTL